MDAEVAWERRRDERTFPEPTVSREARERLVTAKAYLESALPDLELIAAAVSDVDLGDHPGKLVAHTSDLIADIEYALDNWTVQG